MAAAFVKTRAATWATTSTSFSVGEPRLPRLRDSRPARAPPVRTIRRASAKIARSRRLCDCPSRAAAASSGDAPALDASAVCAERQ